MEDRFVQEMAIAAKYKEGGSYADARRHYKTALRMAPPEQMQEIIENIKEMNERAKSVPKPASREDKDASQGFAICTETFNDVIGYKRHKKVVRRILERPNAKGNLFDWFKMPKSTGILLYGPPGTGKTLFTKSLSGELKIPMRDVHINEILDKLVGGSEKNMAKIFEDARKVQPCILFFDELDALGASRENANEFTSNDIKNTINVFLKQTSELHDNKDEQVFVIGATNLPWLVDDAIKRSGRLEHHIYIGPPNFWDRRRLFAHYLDKYGKSVDLNVLAMATIRYSQADIASVCYDAFRIAEEQGRKYVTTREVQKQIKERKGDCLDAWYLKAKSTYIKSEKVIVRRTGFMGWHKQKEKIEEQGKLNSDELKIYKPLINNIKSTMTWWGLCNVVRFFASGI